jgi:cobalt-zinc-cadmium efflux system outer membrane protein
MPIPLKLLLLSGCLLTLCGCASEQPDAGFGDVQQITTQRIGQTVVWRGRMISDDRVRAAIGELLARPMTADSAVQIALINNRSLQATLEDLAISDADLVQAGLLHNPIFFASFRLPDHPPNGTDSELSIEQDFLDLLVLPLRKKVAQAEFEHTKLSVADRVVQLAADVRIAVFTMQASQQLLERLLVISDSNQTAAELSRRQFEAGTINELDFANQQMLAAQSRLDVSIAEQQLDGNREQLNRLMGLTSDQTGWTLIPRLPDLPPRETDTAQLERHAIRQRLDLQAARTELLSLRQAVSVTRGFRYFADVEFGVDTERTPDGQRVTGPTLSLQIPIFDQGQSRVSRAEAQLRAAQDRYVAMAIDATSEVREATDRMLSLRSMVSSTNSIWHQRRRMVDLTLLQYNGMLKGTYDLLTARQKEAEAHRAYIDACRGYWIARTQLELAVGGRLPSGPQTQPAGDSR